MKVKRLYSEEYIQYCSTKLVESNGGDSPQCLTCDDVLVNESLKPSKLRNILENYTA